MIKPKQTTHKTTTSAPSLGATGRGTFANESIYKLYIDIAGVLWGAAMVVAFYFNAVPWKTVITSFCLMAISLICVTGILLRKAILVDDEIRFSLNRSYSLILCEFAWKMLSLGVISLTPALAWDLLGTASITLHKIEESPYLLPVLMAHLIGILFTIMWMRRSARMERIKEVTP